MLILISPAKTLDYQSPLTTTRYTLPELLDNSQQLIHEARKMTPPQIRHADAHQRQTGGINAARFHDWQLISRWRMPAVRFWRLKVMSLTPACRPKPSAKTISILPNSICRNAFRFVWRTPPARFNAALSSEMGIRLENARGKDLYQFLGDIITNKLNEALAAIRR